MHTGQVIEWDADGFTMPVALLETGLRAGDDFTLAYLEYSLYVCRRREAPGENGSSNQPFEYLTPEYLQLFLQESNATWRSGAVPDTWKSSVILPQLKSGKQPNIVASFRPMSLTSCTCKPKDRLVCRRLMWLLEQHEVRSKHIADAVSDLVTDVEAAKSASDTTYVIFLDVFRTFDFLLHDTILGQLPAYKDVGRIYAFIAAFRRDRHFGVRACGITSSPRKVCQGVPPSSVLSPLLLAWSSMIV